MRHFWSFIRMVVPGALVVGVFLVTTLATASELVVLQTSVPGMVPGQVVLGTVPLLLQDGQHVSLIAANGQILELQGPYNQAPDPGMVQKQGVVASLKALVASSGRDDSSFGVSRSATGIIDSANKSGWIPDPWLIDVTRAGNHCVQANQPAVFWRPVKAQAAKLNVLVGKNVWEAETRWPHGVDRLASPPQMPLLDGEHYTFQVDGNKAILTMHIIPLTAQTDGMRAAWMNAKGCKSQTLALLRTL